MESNIGLVLEGGGFRGLYTAGLLHHFAEKNLAFPYVIGVSMGASNATNYLAKQTQRNLDVPYTFINDKRYISYRRLFCKGELFGTLSLTTSPIRSFLFTTTCLLSPIRG